MDHSLNSHTIARTPVPKRRFAKLCLKKKIRSCPPKSSLTNGENFNSKKNGAEELNFLSPILNNEYISTPPFVTKYRPAPRKMSSILFSSGTVSSNNSAADVKFSDSKLFDEIVPNTHSTPTISDEVENLKELEKSVDFSNDKSTDAINYTDDVNVTPRSSHSSKVEVTPDMQDLMDKLYGKVWRSTPGLFKKKQRSILKSADHEKDDLVNELKSLNLSNSLNSSEVCDSGNKYVNNDLHTSILNSLPGSVNASKYDTDTDSKSDHNDDSKSDHNDDSKSDDDDDSKSGFENRLTHNKSDDIIVLNDTDVCITKDDIISNILKEQNIETSELKLNSNESLNLNESDFLHTTKRKVGGRNPLLESSDSNEDNDLKSSKLNVPVSGTESKNLNNKENINKFVEKKKITKKSATVAEKVNTKQIKSSKIPILSDGVVENIQQYSFMASLSDNVPSWRREYKAKHYRDNFKKNKEELASILFTMFNENVFESRITPTVPIIWSSTLNKTAGRAHNKMVKSKGGKDGMTISRRSHIELSIKVVDTAQRLRDTLAHELCHVATWLLDGQLHDQHGPYWKSWVAKVLQRYPELGSIPVRHSLDIHFKYSYKCMKCGYKVDRHSKSIDTEKKRCGYCYGTLQCLLNKKTKEGLVMSTPVKQRTEVTGFALYVKENYSNVRSGSTPHKDAMKFLGRQYAKTKLLGTKQNSNL